MKYWVLDGSAYKADIALNGANLTLSNGLVRRSIDLQTCQTTQFYNLQQDTQLLRAPGYDTFLTLQNKKIAVGEAFDFVSAKLCACVAQIPFQRTETMTENNPYPPAGKAVDCFYTDQSRQLALTIHYEIYDGMPVLLKTVTVQNNGDAALVLDNISTDVLQMNESRSQLFVDSDFNAATDYLGLAIEKYAKHYARYHYDTLEVAPQFRMRATVAPKETITSILAYEMCFGAEYYEQRLIEVKVMHRRIAPWCLDNVLFFHLISNSSAAIRKAVDQCAELGIEMIIQSFGSGVRMESGNDRYLNRIQKAYDYGHSKGLRMGAYTLAYVKNYRPVRSDEALNHDYSHICRCLATEWSQAYMQKILRFIDRTGADAVEIDGPYGMLLCAGGKTHLHEDFTDSQYKQWKLSVDQWYKALKSRGVYINAPDYHFLNGSNRSGIGYEEIAFSEKRMEQLITSRIYYYKGTFDKNPSQGWGFLPLNVYHGGGKQATFFPTKQNHFAFDWALAQITASGVWPTIRGKQVYDSEIGKTIFKKWIQIFKKYRAVLNGITVHFMPPHIDTQNRQRTTGIDAIMNQLPYGDVRGFVMFFNQTDNVCTQTVNIPVYYTGLTDLAAPPPPVANTKNSDISYPLYGETIAPLIIKARDGSRQTFITDEPVLDKEIPPLPASQETERTLLLCENDAQSQVLHIDTNGFVHLQITLEPMSYKWYVLRPNPASEAPTGNATAAAAHENA